MAVSIIEIEPKSNITSSVWISHILTSSETENAHNLHFSGTKTSTAVVKTKAIDHLK